MKQLFTWRALGTNKRKYTFKIKRDYFLSIGFK